MLLAQAAAAFGIIQRDTTSSVAVRFSDRFLFFTYWLVPLLLLMQRLQSVTFTLPEDNPSLLLAPRRFLVESESNALAICTWKKYSHLSASVDRGKHRLTLPLCYWLLLLAGDIELNPGPPIPHQFVKCCCLNARSIVNKRLDLQAMIEDQNLDVIAVTESFLSEDILDSELVGEIGGTPLNQIFRKDRNRHGGGVMLLVRNNIPTTRRYDLESRCELMWIELSLNALKILVGVFYNPPGSNIDALLQLRETLAAVPESSNILLCGDFNLPTINWGPNPPSVSTSNSAANILCDIVDDFNLSQLVLEPTRLDNILDLLLTNRADIVNDLVVADGLPGSDHDGIFFTLNVLKKRVPTHHRRMYNFKKADFK